MSAPAPVDPVPTAEPVDDGKGLLAGLAAAAVPLVWLTVLMFIGIAELLIDPDQENDVGELLNAVSVVWLGLGVILVPVGAAAIARWFGVGTVQFVAIGVLALVVLLLGAWLEALLWNEVLYEAVS